MSDSPLSPESAEARVPASSETAKSVNPEAGGEPAGWHPRLAQQFQGYLEGGELPAPLGALLSEINQTYLELERSRDQAEAELRQAAEALQAINDIARATLDLPSLPGAMQAVTQRVHQLLQADACYLTLWDESRGLPVPTAASGPLQQLYPTLRPQPGEHTLTEAVLQAGQTLVVERAAEAQGLNHPTIFALSGASSFLCLPLIAGQQKLGALLVAYEQPHTFSPALLLRGEQAAQQIALALAKARLLETERAQRVMAEVLGEASTILAGTQDPERLLDGVLEQVVHLLPCDCAVLMLAEGGEMRVARSRGYQRFGPELERTINTLALPAAATPNLQQICQTLRPLILPDTAADPGWIHILPSGALRSWLGVPLVRQGEVLGLFAVEKVESDFYRPEHATAASIFAHQAAAAIERMRLFQAMQRRERETAVVLDLVQTVTASLDLDEVMLRVATSLAQAMDMDHCAISGYDTTQEVVITRAVYSRDGQYDPETLGRAYPLHDYPLTRLVLATHEVVFQRVSDATADAAEVAYLRESRAETLLMTSLRASGRTVGLVELLGNDPARAFTPDDKRLMRALADQAGMAYEHARLYRAERLQREVAEVLREAGAALGAALEYDAVLDRLAEYLGRVAPFDQAGILRVEAGLVRAVRLRVGEEGDPSGGAVLDGETCPLNRVPLLAQMQDTGQVMLSDNTRLAAEARPPGSRPDSASWLGAPVFIPTDGLVAFLWLEQRAPRAYTSRQAEGLAAFAGQASLALQNSRLFASQRQRAAELDAVRQVSLSLASSLELPVVLQAVMQAVFSLVSDADEARIYLYHDTGAGQLVFGASRHRDGRSVAERIEPRADGLTYRVAREGRLVAVADIATPPLFSPEARAWGGAIASLPLKIGQRVVGVMNVIYPRPHDFPESELRLLRLLADQAAVAIENARLFEASQRQTQELSALYDTTVGTASILEQEPLLKLVVGQIQKLLVPDACAVVLNHPERDEVELALGIEQGQPLPRVRMPLSDGGLSAWVIRNRQPLLVADLDTDLLPVPYVQVGGSTRGWLGVPLIAGDQALGAISVQSFRPGAFTDADRRFLESLASQVAATLQRAQLYAATQRQLREQTLLFECSQDWLGTYDVPEALARTAGRIRQHFQAVGIAIYTHDERSRALTLQHLSAASPEPATRDTRLLREHPLLEQLLQTRGLHLLYPDDSRLSPAERRLAAQWHSQALGIVPLVVRDHLLGCLLLWQTERRLSPEHPANGKPGYDEAQQRLLTALANQTAIALDNVGLYAEVRDKATELERLYLAAQDMGSSLEPRLVLQHLVRHITEAVAATSGSVLEVNWDDDTLAVLAEYWSHAAVSSERQSDLGQVYFLRDYPAVSRAIARGEVTILQADAPDLSETERQQMANYGVQSSLIVPIVSRGRVLGSVDIRETRRRRVFTAAECRLAQTLVRHAAGLVENAHLFTALTNEKQRLELLYDLSQRLTGSMDLADLARRALEQIRASFSAFKAIAYVTQPGTDRLRLVAITDENAAWVREQDRHLNLRLGQGLAGWVALKRRAVIAVDVARDPHWTSTPGLDDWVHSAVCVPLIAGDELVGVISLYSDQRGAFRASQLPLLTAAAAPVAAALQNARLFAETAEFLVREQRLNEIARAISGALDLQALGPTIMRLAAELVNADAGFMALLSPNSDRLDLPFTFNAPAGLGDPLPPFGTGQAWELVTGGTPVLVENYADYQSAVPAWTAMSVRSLMAVPVVSGQEGLGVLGLLSLAPEHQFNARDLALAESVGRQAGVAIQNARFFAAAHRNADELLAASEILRLLNVGPDVLQVFPAVTIALRTISQSERVSLAFVDESTGTYTLAAIDEPRPELHDGEPIPLDATDAAADALAGRPHLTPDLAAVSGLAVEQRLLAAGYRSRVVLPLRIGERVLGTLNLMWTQPHGYRQTNLTLLSQIADAMALAAEKSRLFAETRRRADELETVSQVSAGLRVAGSRSEIMQVVLARSLAIFHASRGAIAVPGPQPGTLMIAVEQGWPMPLAGMPDLDDSIFGHVFRTGQPYASADILRDPLCHSLTVARYRAAGSVGLAGMFAPLRAAEAVTGIILVADPVPRTFSDADTRLLLAVADIAGNALNRAGVMETLEQRVAERTRELREANERLTQLDRLKDQFVANVSHELRTPLTSIKLHLSLLDKRGPEALGRYLPSLLTETDRLHKLIEDLLNISRLQMEVVPPRRADYVLDGLLAEVITMHAARAESRRISLRHELLPEEIKIPVDRDQIMLVFINLVRNAVVYTPEGGQVNLTSRLDEERTHLVVSVHNDGPPIPPEDLQHLFERFYRGQRGLDSGEPGTGLGLAISQDIVERHGGRMEVHSDESHGTVFTIWLPLQVPPPPDHPAAPASA